MNKLNETLSVTIIGLAARQTPQYDARLTTRPSALPAMSESMRNVGGSGGPAVGQMRTL